MHLAQAYFHQDYDLEAATPLDAVGIFIDCESQAAVDELASDIESVLNSTMTDTEIRALWVKDYGASYDPAAEGIECRRWFTDVLYKLAQR